MVAAILGSNLKDGSAWLYLGFTLLFGVLSLIGYFTVLQLARLRIAWQSGATAMNKVIQYYVEHSTDKKVAEHLIWFKNKDALDNRGRIESVSFLLALSVIAADFGTTVVSFIYGGKSLFMFAEDRFISIPELVTGCLIGLAVITGFIFARFQICEYFTWVRKSSVDELPGFLERLLNWLRLVQPSDLRPTPENKPVATSDPAIAEPSK